MRLSGVGAKSATVLLNGLIVVFCCLCLYFIISGIQLRQAMKELDKRTQEDFKARFMSDKQGIEEQLRAKYSAELNSFEKTNMELKAIKSKIKQAQQKENGK